MRKRWVAIGGGGAGGGCRMAAYLWLVIALGLLMVEALPAAIKIGK